MDAITEFATCPDLPPLLVVTGPAGVGRTTLLADLRVALGHRDVRTYCSQFTPAMAGVPANLALRPDDPAGRDHEAGPVPRPDFPMLPWAPVGPVPHAASDPGAARLAAAAAAAPLLLTGDAVVLLDDVQWIDRDTLAVLEALIRRIAGTTVKCVCAVRTPASGVVRTAGLAVLRRLRREGLVHELRMNPLRPAEITKTIRELTKAAPEERLVRQLTSLTRGLPAALHGSVAVMQELGAVQVVNRQAFLVPGSPLPRLPPTHQMLRMIHQLGPETWRVAKALAVLHPLGEQAVPLIGEALDVTPARVREKLENLVREGIVHHSVGKGSWRFVVPVVASTLVAHLGPYERRALAAKAVTALWSGTAQCPDPDYLTDQLATAGRLTDPARACATLLDRAAARSPDTPEIAHRMAWWLHAGSELAGDRTQQALMRLQCAWVCTTHGDYRQSLEALRPLLRDLRELQDEFTEETQVEVQLMAVWTLYGTGRVDEVEEIAAGRLSWSESPTPRVLARVASLVVLDCWPEVAQLLAETRQLWQDNELARFFGSMFEVLAALWTGHPQPFQATLAARDRWSLREVERLRVRQTIISLSTLLTLGDLRQAERLLAAEHLDPARLPLSDQALLARMRGDADTAVDLALRHHVMAGAHGWNSNRAPMHLAAAEVLVSRGRLTAARELLAAAWSPRPMLAHLITCGEAHVLEALGDRAEATTRLVLGHTMSSDGGVVAATELVTFRLAEQAVDRGDLPTALTYLTELENIAHTMQTERARLYALLLRAAIKQDTSVGEECIALARERGQSFEVAWVIARLVRSRAAGPELLPEAYQILGDNGALLYRARMRYLMRRHSIAVPGRQVAVAENERLLAVLVSEGLGNKQLARVLRTSDKSVEGRLSRLFARTGLRSRIELSAALMSGEYPE
ncbi:LuxR family transcriptional regulator [Amycolatopsis ultiminotia]|uniref:LuxR family transcriptional regulator n=1 Tax=Amycolatopsis ultiminotia TaxID=543629 RepID=A0ABP6YP09_9PSEU